MRLMGIDYGTKRVGIALSDERGIMAFAHDTFPNDQELLERIEALVVEKGVEAVVIGKSHDREGAPNKIQKDIDVFVEKLTELIAIQVHQEPEQYSTQAALRLQGRTEKTDASAAALILDMYITRHQKPL